MPPKAGSRRSCHNLFCRVAIVTGADGRGDDLRNDRVIYLLPANYGASVIHLDRDLSVVERTIGVITAEGSGAGIAVQAVVCNKNHCGRIIQTNIAKLNVWILWSTMSESKALRGKL